jgi:hypothetical protein
VPDAPDSIGRVARISENTENYSVFCKKGADLARRDDYSVRKLSVLQGDSLSGANRELFSRNSDIFSPEQGNKSSKQGSVGFSGCATRASGATSC